jgi:hypothetical protein
VRLRLAILAAALAGCSAAAAADNSAGARLAGSYNAPNPGGLFYLEPSRRIGLQESFVTYKHDGLFLHASAYRQTQEGMESQQKGVLNELYFDTHAGDWDLTLGKKRMEWGVGFGFRPLDVIKPLARRELIALTPEGLPLLALERYSETSALTFLAGNDLHHNDEGWRHADTEYAARYYTLAGGVDVQAVLHRRPDIDTEGGVALSWVPSDELELHGSALYQRRYRKLINTLTESGALLASSDPMVSREFEHGTKALIGGTYTWRSGHALLLEYWHDAAGYTREEWKRLRELTQAQRALLGSGLDTAIEGNIRASSQYLLQPNLMQQNWLARWSYDNGDRWVTALDLLYTPQDRGRVLTLSSTHDIGTAYNLSYGARHYGGDADSVYRALPYRYIVYASLRATFNW